MTRYEEGKIRPCNKCGAECEIRGVGHNSKIRVCTDPECNWRVAISGSWTSPRRESGGGEV